MSIRNLQYAFKPRSVVLIGASDRVDSVGQKLLENLTTAGFPGSVFAVNPNRPNLGATPVFASVDALPSAPDLAVIATPAHTVPGIIAQLARLGTRAAVVISAGFGELSDSQGAELQRAMLDAAKPNLMRVIGPNCVGILVPESGLNASFAHLSPRPGNIAFATQSGALLTAVLDWADSRGIGFSHLLSLGGMADVDFGDVLDYLANDESTSAILLYVEAVTHARKFMSAARAAARTKPVIVCKSGRHTESARAARSHSGALAGSDAVYAAAFRRAGMLRVFTLEDLFDAVEMLSTPRQPHGDRLAIVTNGGGMGILATDRLLDLGGRLASLTPATMDALDRTLPAAWSRGNPVDLVGDATADRYRQALDTVIADPNVDAVVVLNCPVALASGVDSARVVVETRQHHRDKPLIASWTGGTYQLESRRVFAEHRVPSYATPEDAIRGFMYLVDYQRSQAALMETPPSLPAAPAYDREGARRLIAQEMDQEIAQEAAQEIAPEAAPEVTQARDGGWLDPLAARQLLGAYGIPYVASLACATPAAAGAAARELGVPVALKIDSPDITHKTDVGGVALDLHDPEAVETAAEAMLRRIRERQPEARLTGFTVEPMAGGGKNGFELLVGAYEDAQFGPVMVFGHGGTAVEVRADTALGLPPLNIALAREMMARTRIHRLLEGYRNIPAVDLAAVSLVLVRLSQLIVDLPEVVEIDVNPLVADRAGATALDVRIRVQAATRPGTERLAICPYPSELEETVTLDDGRALWVRPIRPEDEPALHAAFGQLTPDEIQSRFFFAMRSLSHLMAARFTQIDYDREMALVLTEHGSPGTMEIYGVVRMRSDPDRERAEFAIIVREILSNRGLGTLLMHRIIDHARTLGIGVLFGLVERGNVRMLELCRELGFSRQPDASDPALVMVSLDVATSGRIEPTTKR